MPLFIPNFAYLFLDKVEDFTSPSSSILSQLQTLMKFALEIAKDYKNIFKTDQIFIRRQFIEYYNSVFDNPKLLEQFKKNTKDTPEMLLPFSNIIDELTYVFGVNSIFHSMKFQNEDDETNERFCFECHFRHHPIALEAITSSKGFGFYSFNAETDCKNEKQKEMKNKLGLIVIKEDLEKYEIFLLNCIQYILAYCGYRFVITTNKTNTTISDILSPGFVIECHIFSDDILPLIKKEMVQYNTFVYLYTYKQNEDVITKIMNKEVLPLIQVIYLSSPFNDIFPNKLFKFDDVSIFNSLTNIKLYCPNIPIYEKDDPNEDVIPYRQTRKEFYIVPFNKFQSWCNGRFPLTDNGYTNFDDIHYLNITHFLNEDRQIFTADVSDKIIKNVSKVLRHCVSSQKPEKHFIKKFKSHAKSLKNNKKPKKDLKKSLYYLKELIPRNFKDNDKKAIILRNTQLLSIYHCVYETIMSGVNQQKDNPSHKGTIYQIDTGEGKTMTIICIACILACAGFKIHIITHSIDLACDGFYMAYNFIDKLGKKCRLLLDQNEKNSLFYLKEEKFQKSGLFKDEKFEKDPLLLNRDALKGDIIFSTAFNFEAAYLSELEKSPKANLLHKTICLIDEADSLLLDEKFYGTTISKPIKSNVEDAITTIYQIAEQTQNLPFEQRKNILLYKMVSKHPFIRNVSIETLLQNADDVRTKMIKRLHYFIQKKPSPFDSTKKTRQIVPYNYKKGTLETNKQFDGYIHQFIGAKENLNIDRANAKLLFKQKRENVEIEPLAINYLYTSHLSYLKHYNSLHGFTGTIGSAKDIEFYLNKYNLKALKVPRHISNNRFDLIPVLVDSIDERNKLICADIKQLAIYNKTHREAGENRSALIILESPSEIPELHRLLSSDDISSLVSIRIATGIFKYDNKSKEENRYMDVILAVNNFGRGKNADTEVKNGNHMYVILGYYSHNTRSVYQALGRTGRNGKLGITKIICLKQQYFSSILVNKAGSKTLVENMNSSNDPVDLIQEARNDIVEMLNEKKCEWIFDETKITEKSVNKLPSEFFINIRKYQSNVSRITAIEYEFPFGFTTEEYIHIQKQRIFSLINCPNCIYTWKLISRYYREMLLEGWSLMCSNINELTPSVIQQKKSDYLGMIDQFLPPEKPTIGECFLYLCDQVNKSLTELIMKSTTYKFMNITCREAKMISIKIGIFPFTAIKVEKSMLNSGIKFEPTITIQDPELKYDHFSITHLLDWIFKIIYGFFDWKIGEKCGLHAYLRRTIAGTEFGVCFQPFTEDSEIQDFLNLYDTAATFIAAMCVKSETVIFVAILLLLAATLSVVIGLILAIPALGAPKTLAEVMKKLFNKGKEFIEETLLDGIAESICNVLVNVIKRIMKERFYGSIIQAVLQIWIQKDTEPSFLKKKSKLGKPGFKVAVTFVLLVAAFFSTFKKTPEITCDSNAKCQVVEVENDTKQVDESAEFSYDIDKVTAPNISAEGELENTFIARQQQIKFENIAREKFGINKSLITTRYSTYA